MHSEAAIPRDQLKKARRNAAKVLQKNEFEEIFIELDENDDAVEEAKNDPKQWFSEHGVEFFEFQM